MCHRERRRHLQSMQIGPIEPDVDNRSRGAIFARRLRAHSARHPPPPRRAEELSCRQMASEWRVFGPSPPPPGSAHRLLCAGQPPVSQQTGCLESGAPKGHSGNKSGNKSERDSSHGVSAIPCALPIGVRLGLGESRCSAEGGLDGRSVRRGVRSRNHSADV